MRAIHFFIGGKQEAFALCASKRPSHLSLQLDNLPGCLIGSTQHFKNSGAGQPIHPYLLLGNLGEDKVQTLLENMLDT